MKTFMAAALMIISLNSFAAGYDLYCSNAQGDHAEVSITITGEPQTNGTWDYVSADATARFNVKGHTGLLAKPTVMVLTKDGWDLDVYKIYHGNSELINVVKKGKKITARYVDAKRDVRFTCEEVKF